jgi:hypothetical protein
MQNPRRPSSAGRSQPPASTILESAEVSIQLDHAIGPRSVLLIGRIKCERKCACDIEECLARAQEARHLLGCRYILLSPNLTQEKKLSEGEVRKDEVYLRLLKATKPIVESAREIEQLADTLRTDKRFLNMLKIVRDHIVVSLSALNVGLSKEERQRGEPFSKGENFKLLETKLGELCEQQFTTVETMVKGSAYLAASPVIVEHLRMVIQNYQTLLESIEEQNRGNVQQQRH